jgi:hypothetical protein
MCRAQRRAELHEEWRRAGGRGKVVKAFRKAAGTGDALARDVLDRLLEHDELTTGSYYSGKTFTGFSFGAGCVVSRLYLKTRELKKSGKGWMREVWARDASVGGLALIYRGRPVWRLEFQLRRELLKDAKASDGPAFAQGRVVVENRQRVEPHAVFARWSTAAPLLADLWRYLMTDWLELRLPRRADTRRTPRQAWVALRERAEFKGSVPCFGVWRRHIEDARVRTLGQAGGYAARGLAERWALDNAADVVPDRLEPEAELQRWLKELRSYAQAHRGDVVDRALERWDLLNYRRQLYGAAAV